MSRYPTTPMCNGAILEGFEPTVRDSDVFTATIAKCGQTWLTALLYHLKTRGRMPDLGGRGLMHHIPWLELPYNPGADRAPYDVSERLAELEAMGDPRVFKMHVIWDEIPRPPGSRSKVITITRDPRDVPFSMYRHLAGLTWGPFHDNGTPEFAEWFETWFDNGYYFKFIENFWPRRDNPDLLWLRYEDLKRDLRGEAERVVAFLGWDLDEADIDRAVPLVDFSHMQKTESATLPGGAFKEPFFREGAVGKNRARLTAEMEQRIVDRARAEFSPEAFRFLLAQGV